MMPYYKGGDATDEEREKSKEMFCKMMDILEDKFKDGRKYCAGDQLTASDFKVLSEVVAFIENPHGRF